jgi:hypothetical protein
MGGMRVQGRKIISLTDGEFKCHKGTGNVGNVIFKIMRYCQIM